MGKLTFSLHPKIAIADNANKSFFIYSPSYFVKDCA